MRADACDAGAVWIEIHSYNLMAWFCITSEFWLVR